MSNKVCIDEREALDVLDLMRTAIPDEIKQARRTNQEREKVLAQAQTESNRILTQAQERVDRLVAESNVTIAAEQRAREIVDQARSDAEEIRRGADEYALQMLDRLDDQLRRITGNVRNAISALSTQPASQQDEEE
jgi:vacuolar-type H+-ATPase subunit H